MGHEDRFIHFRNWNICKHSIRTNMLNCKFEGNPNKTCLMASYPPDTTKKLPTGVSKETCSGAGDACGKMEFNMKFLGKEYKFSERRCVEGLAAISPKCIPTDVPLDGGQTGKANMCLCASELCNTASFSVQGSILTLFVSIVAIVLKKMI